MLEVKVITPKCQRRSSKGSDYNDYVRNMLHEKIDVAVFDKPLPI